MHLVDNSRRSGHKIQIILAFQTLLYDFQMKKPEKTAPESKPEGHGGLRLVVQRSVIELQLFQGIPQIRIFGAVCRIDTAVHHGIHLFVSGKRLRTGASYLCHRIAHRSVLHILDGGRDIAHGSGGKLVAGSELPRTEISHLHHLGGCSRSHHPDACPLTDPPFHDTAEDNDSLIGIVDGVKNKRLQRVVRIPRRGRNFSDNGL